MESPAIIAYLTGQQPQLLFSQPQLFQPQPPPQPKRIIRISMIQKQEFPPKQLLQLLPYINSSIPPLCVGKFCVLYQLILAQSKERGKLKRSICRLKYSMRGFIPRLPRFNNKKMIPKQV